MITTDELIDGLHPLQEYIPYSKQHIEPEDVDAVSHAVQTPWIAGGGPIAEKFRDELSEYTGWRYVLLVNSATSGLFAAAATSLSQKDKFVIPALTFVATGNALKMAGYGTHRIEIRDVSPISNVLHHADIGVSYAGYPVQFCQIADDAHYLHPNSADWRKCKVAVASFHPVKPITTGEGGAIFTNSEKQYLAMKSFIDHGRGRTPLMKYAYGHNFRMPEMSAALGLSQLKRERENLEKRKEIARTYYEMLSGIGPELIGMPANHEMHSWHLFTIKIRDMPRDLLRECLVNLRIGTSIHYPPLYLYDHLAMDRPYNKKERTERYPATEDMWNNGVSIPIYSSLDPLMAIEISIIIRRILERWYEYKHKSPRDRSYRPG